jgi:hypothetical protein
MNRAENAIYHFKTELWDSSPGSLGDHTNSQAVLLALVIGHS